ncbi:hypothetical protein QTG56_23975 (plasmid) [Rossellomorea sp. AcN35-11]|nr:hypothetical protein [Rossellomorea aquimaris]WJV31697.1 hypothetical protein QTG56_23975 [Rossellomorea sp. AcN35-11]
MQMTLEEIFPEKARGNNRRIKTKPTSTKDGESIFEYNALLQLLTELEGNTFTIEYKDEMIELRLPFLSGAARHYVPYGSASEFTLQTGKTDLSSLSTMMFSGAGKVLRQIRMQNNQFKLFYGRVDWNQKRKMEPTGEYLMTEYFPYTDELIQSPFVLHLEKHAVYDHKLKIPKKDTIENPHEYLTNSFASIKVDPVVDDIVSCFTTIPFRLKEVKDDEGILHVKGPNELYLKSRSFTGLHVYPKSITGHSSLNTGEPSQPTTHLHFI